jgi:hypothetical protein
MRLSSSGSIRSAYAVMATRTSVNRLPKASATYAAAGAAELGLPSPALASTIPASS